MTKYEMAREIQKLNPHTCMEIMYDAFTKEELEGILKTLKKHQNYEKIH